jgi:hypothetical protein
MQLSTTAHYKDNIFRTQAKTESMFTLTNSMLAYFYNLAPTYIFAITYQNSYLLFTNLSVKPFWFKIQICTIISTFQPMSNYDSVTIHKAERCILQRKGR